MSSHAKTEAALLALSALVYVPLLAALDGAARSSPDALPPGATAVVSGAALVAAAFGARAAVTRVARRAPTSREFARAVVGVAVVDLLAHVALAAGAVGSGSVQVLAVGALALSVVATVALHVAALYGATALSVRGAARRRTRGPALGDGRVPLRPPTSAR